jgi:hypothetical protein
MDPENIDKKCKPEGRAPQHDVGESRIDDDIDLANEIQGLKLVLIHFSICLCTFLIGLVSPLGFSTTWMDRLNESSPAY